MSDEPTPEVLAIYDAYPRKEAKRPALKAIHHAIVRIADSPNAPADPAAWLLAEVRRYAAGRKGQDPKYTPHPATWFNGDRWLDEQPIDNRRVDDNGKLLAPKGKYAHLS